MAERTTTRLTTQDRFLALLVALGTIALLSTASWLSPSSNGHGTHTQLGLASCQWAEDLAIPCPTCGMTTSFALAAEGRIVQAGQTQPFGLLLVVLTSVGFWACAHSAATGSRASVLMLHSITQPRVIYPLLVLFLGAWGYKAVIW
ncbi:MAG: DUF2752 domain-containing protein [Planctomycetota bacterium]|jgi:hypothetical protein